MSSGVYFFLDPHSTQDSSERWDKISRQKTNWLNLIWPLHPSERGIHYQGIFLKLHENMQGFFYTLWFSFLSVAIIHDNSTYLLEPTFWNSSSSSFILSVISTICRILAPDVMQMPGVIMHTVLDMCRRVLGILCTSKVWNLHKSMII